MRRVSASGLLPHSSSKPPSRIWRASDGAELVPFGWSRNCTPGYRVHSLMKHFLAAWPRVMSSLKESHILLCLDFDGTLAPIVQKPSEALLPLRIRGVLKTLKAKDWCTVAVISGRTLRSLIRKVRLEGIIYGGNHGS